MTDEPAPGTWEAAKAAQHRVLFSSAYIKGLVMTSIDSCDGAESTSAAKDDYYGLILRTWPGLSEKEEILLRKVAHPIKIDKVITMTKDECRSYLSKLDNGQA